MKQLLIIIACIFAFNAFSEEFKGYPVYVADGDSLIIQSKGLRYYCRLEGIDAPEFDANDPGFTQPHGKESREMLIKLLGKYPVKIVHDNKQDRYGRLIVTIYAGKINVNYAMVRFGNAWHYKAYSKDKALAEAEKEAREKKRGLWKEKNPVEPSLWRKTHEKKSKLEV